MAKVTLSEAGALIRRLLEERELELEKARADVESAAPCTGTITACRENIRTSINLHLLEETLVETAIARQRADYESGMAKEQVVAAQAYALEAYKELRALCPPPADRYGEEKFLECRIAFYHDNISDNPLRDPVARKLVHNSLSVVARELDIVLQRTSLREHCTRFEKDQELWKLSCEAFIKDDKKNPSIQINDAAAMELARTLVDTALIRCDEYEKGIALSEDEIECAKEFVASSYGELRDLCKLPSEEGAVEGFRSCLKRFHYDHWTPPPKGPSIFKKLFDGAIRLWHEIFR